MSPPRVNSQGSNALLASRRRYRHAVGLVRAEAGAMASAGSANGSCRRASAVGRVSSGWLAASGGRARAAALRPLSAADPGRGRLRPRRGEEGEKGRWEGVRGPRPVGRDKPGGRRPHRGSRGPSPLTPGPDALVVQLLGGHLTGQLLDGNDAQTWPHRAAPNWPHAATLGERGAWQCLTTRMPNRSRPSQVRASGHGSGAFAIRILPRAPAQRLVGSRAFGDVTGGDSRRTPASGFVASWTACTASGTFQGRCSGWVGEYVGPSAPGLIRARH